MAQSEAEGGLEITITELIEGLIESYRYMTIPLERYLFFILLPSVAFFILSVVGALLLDLSLMIRAPIPLLGFLAMASAVFYPKRTTCSRSRNRLSSTTPRSIAPRSTAWKS